MSAPAPGENTERRIVDARRAGFYPLMLLLERMQRGRTPVGTNGAPEDEGVRFRHDPSLCFSPSDVSGLKRHTRTGYLEDGTETTDDLYEITTTFLGLTGAVSPLPGFFSEELIQDDNEASRTREFLDLFHHRLLSLIYRAQSRYDLPNSRRSDGSDPWSQRLMTLLGFDEASTLRGNYPSWRVLRLAGFLCDGEITASALEVALTDELDDKLGSAKISIEQFVGSWVMVEDEHITLLGQNASVLGKDLLLGKRVFDRAGKFRVVIGPLSSEGYANFGEGSEALYTIARTLATLQGGSLEYEVVLWLSREAAPTLRLSSQGQTRLGKNSWLGGQSREERIRVPVPTI